MSKWFEKHQDVLSGALKAISERGYWSAYPEIPSKKIYGEDAPAIGQDVYNGLLNKPFDLPGHPAGDKRVGQEISPYGPDLGITYPAAGIEDLVSSAGTAGDMWGRATVKTRVGVCLEILHRLNQKSFEMAHAVSHTTGQAFIMAFQAGGPHAQDRGLEAVAYACREMTQTPESAGWEKPQGKHDPLRLTKEYRILPRGIALTIGCSTFPTWNSYPGLFASLATGNPVIVKPHPMAILPLALTVKIGREVLEESGFDPNLLLLAVDEPGAEITKDLVTHPEVKIIDFTGSGTFGTWVRQNSGSALVFSEEAGVNSIVIDSTDDFKGMVRNIAFSLALYSGQMCTAPQNLFIPSEGIDTDLGHMGVDEVAAALATGLDKLLEDQERALGICGAIQNPVTLERARASADLGQVIRKSGPIEGIDDARTATPAIIRLEAGESDVYQSEQFGPISFLVVTGNTDEAISRASSLAREKGAITAAIYSTDETVLAQAADAFTSAGACLSMNLTGGIHVNQSAAFSDYHVTGANPAGNACLTDSAFVANRFRIAMVRRPVKA